MKKCLTAFLFSLLLVSGLSYGADNRPSVLDNDILIAVMDQDQEELLEPYNLGFDPYLYLPEDFDPYVGMPVNMEIFEVFEEVADFELDFDTTPHLPVNFNPYKGM